MFGEVIDRYVQLVYLLLHKEFTVPLLGYVLYLIVGSSSSSSSSQRVDDIPKAEVVTSVTSVSTETSEKKTNTSSDNVIPKINSIDSSFDWSKQDPVKYRPFKKGEYKLVMGIHNISPDEWFFVENTYKEYTDLKWSYVTNPDLFDHAVFMTEDCIPATIEFYQRSTQFMLDRYPMCFEIRGDQIYNKIRDDYIPLDPYSVEDKKQLHVYLSRFLEEDYIILYPDTENYDTEEYIFKGGIFAFAAGFDPQVRFKKPLTEIHGPVPEYRTKLRPQMNRFFDKLKPGTWVRRNNWSIQTHNMVFAMSENKGKEDEEITSLDPDTLDFEREVFFRSERQILTKLPKTGAIIFSIRTYLTPMKQLRDEGIGEELIGGIEGMQNTIGQYKRRPEWGDAVCAYLRGESNGCQKPEIKGLV